MKRGLSGLPEQMTSWDSTANLLSQRRCRFPPPRCPRTVLTSAARQETHILETQNPRRTRSCKKILHTDPAITAQMCCVCVTVFTPGLNRKARAGRERSDQATSKRVLGSRNKIHLWMERSREGTWQNKCPGEAA